MILSTQHLKHYLFGYHDKHNNRYLQLCRYKSTVNKQHLKRTERSQMCYDKLLRVVTVQSDCC